MMNSIKVMEIICYILQILALLQCIVCRRAVFRNLGIQYISGAYN